MPSYTAPVDDMLFLFEKLRDNKNYNDLKKYDEVSLDLVKDILEEAAKINQNLILPLAKIGDENPAVLENGVVRTPPGYKEAYQKYIEDGWTSLSCDPKYGGQGMPKTVSGFFDEMLSSASLSFKLYSELSIGAYNCINHHAPEEIKEKYLPKIVEGKWSGTMCLTEPVCGTDLGLLKTKAAQQTDGTYKISGQKIFITSGDHDLTENIIHLVLARSTDSPAGTKGISLFLVPKFIVNEDGTIGAPFLSPHYDETFKEPRFTFDYQMRSNTSWPLVVEEKQFALEDNQALTFSGTHQIHWRTKKEFSSEDFVDMIFFHLKKIKSEPKSHDVNLVMNEKAKHFIKIYEAE